MNDNSLKYIYFFTQIPKLGNVKIKNIISRFAGAEEAFYGERHEYLKIEGISNILADEIISSRKNEKELSERFNKLINEAEKKNIKLVSIFEKKYPVNLKKIYDAPVLLYYKGNLSSQDKYSISIVGTRRPTSYGRTTCQKFTEELSLKKIPVISGFARGVDSVAHSIAIKNDNLTYAVLGCGVDIIYPPENRKLYEEICEKGAVISEFSIGEEPERVNFPKRNRLISGISLGTLVIESGARGGALLTAEFALDQNKEVFAIPGYINSPQSEGTNSLIKKSHAKLVTSTDEILNELNIQLKPVLEKENHEKINGEIENLKLTEKKIFEKIEYEPIHIDLINEITGMSISDCLVNLLSLEFKGLIRQLPGKNFVRA